MAQGNRTGGGAGQRRHSAAYYAAANAASSVRIARRRLQEYLEDAEKANVMFACDLHTLARVLNVLDRGQHEIDHAQRLSEGD